MFCIISVKVLCLCIAIRRARSTRAEATAISTSGSGGWVRPRTTCTTFRRKVAPLEGLRRASSSAAAAAEEEEDRAAATRPSPPRPIWVITDTRVPILCPIRRRGTRKWITVSFHNQIWVMCAGGGEMKFLRWAVPIRKRKKKIRNLNPWKKISFAVCMPLFELNSNET